MGIHPYSLRHIRVESKVKPLKLLAKYTGILLCNERSIQHYLFFTMCFVTKATAIGYTDSQCHFKETKKQLDLFDWLFRLHFSHE